jgi:hypothetical protein
MPVVRSSHLTPAERRAYALSDNKRTLNAGRDSEILAIELQGLIDLDFDVTLTGFSLAEVDVALDHARETLPNDHPQSVSSWRRWSSLRADLSRPPRSPGKISGRRWGPTELRPGNGGKTGDIAKRRAKI